MSSFSFAHWLLIIAIVYIVYRAASGFLKGGNVSEHGAMVCQNCGTRGTPNTMTKGSVFIEIVLWLCFLVPGLIYSIWRLTTRYPACPSCGNAGMIGVDTPKGKQLIEKASV